MSLDGSKQSFVELHSRDNPEKYLIESYEDYEKKWSKSIKDPADFWAHEALENLAWHKPFNHVFSRTNGKAKWFDDGALNVSYNCLDRHLEKKANKTALHWENEKGQTQKISYAELHKRVVDFSACLKQQGLKPGDAVTLYLSMTPDLVVAMLSCCRIGVLHNVVFAGFSAESLRSRIDNSNSKLVITADGFYRKNKIIPLKKVVEQALEGQTTVEKVLLFDNGVCELKSHSTKEVFVKDLLAQTNCSQKEDLKFFPSEQPLFLLYTSGSTGSPKGLLHTSAGYLLGARMTCRYLFNLKDDDIFWCTADLGWITGHTYLVYGPLTCGATIFMFDGAPNTPNWGRWWELIEKYQVTKLYTAPTALKMFMKEGPEYPAKHNLDSLRLLACAGEPINPKTWHWFFETIGQNRCPLLDTWWQTETGSIMLSPLPGVTKLKPGSASVPLFGVNPEIRKHDGDKKGQLVLKQPWPSMARTIYNDHERYEKEYWCAEERYYKTSDGAFQDKDGYYWITGRLDDVINISGHRLSTMEVEAKLVAHPYVVEAAVVGVPHEITGQALSCFVVLADEHKDKDCDQAKEALVYHLVKSIGAFARPYLLTISPMLPRTRSGKILRRILRNLSSKEKITSDLSTLEDPRAIEVVRENLSL